MSVSMSMLAERYPHSKVKRPDTVRECYDRQAPAPPRATPLLLKSRQQILTELKTDDKLNPIVVNANIDGFFTDQPTTVGIGNGPSGGSQNKRIHHNFSVLSNEP